MYVPARTRYSPLGLGDTDELMSALDLPQVFEFIGEMPTRGNFILDLHTALAGQPQGYDEQGQNFAALSRRDAGQYPTLSQVTCRIYANQPSVPKRRASLLVQAKFDSPLALHGRLSKQTARRQQSQD